MNTGNRKVTRGIPGWRSGLAPAFGPGRDPGDPGSNPTSGSRCMEPASPSAYVSASFSLSLSVTIIKKIKIKKIDTILQVHLKLAMYNIYFLDICLPKSS